MIRQNAEMDAKEWFDTLPGYALDQIKHFTPETAIEHIEGAIEELNDIAQSLRNDIELK